MEDHVRPRKLGDCHIEGDCERVPDMGGLRADNDQGSLMLHSGVSASRCAQRAKDHFQWCGNHPDRPISTTFSRELGGRSVRREGALGENDLGMELGQASFPPVSRVSEAADAALAKLGAEAACFESYQIAAGSEWTEVLCARAEGGCGDGRGLHSFTVRAVSEVSVSLCQGGEANLAKTLRGALSVTDLNTDQPAPNGCAAALSSGILLSRVNGERCPASGNPHPHVRCCLHDTSELLHAAMTWRACLRLCPFPCHTQEECDAADAAPYPLPTPKVVRGEATLDAISEHVVQEKGGVFMQFDLASAYYASHPGTREEKEEEDGGDEEGRVLREGVAQALSLQGDAIFKAMPGFGPGWNCSCDDTSRGAPSPKEPACCDDPDTTPSKFARSAGEEVWRWAGPSWGGGAQPTVFAFDAVAEVGVRHVSRAVRFLAFLRQMQPALFISSSDVHTHVWKLLFGESCALLAAPRNALQGELGRLEKQAVAAIQAKRQQGARYQLVVLALGHYTPLLQHRLWTALQALGPGQEEGVFLLDLGGIAHVLSGANSDHIGAALGFDEGFWLRDTGFQPDVFSILLSRATAVRARLRILVTTALVEKEGDFWNRTALYETQFKTLARLGYAKPAIVEAISFGADSTFLERYGHVVYTNVNEFVNQGCNEGRSILLALEEMQWEKDTIVVKLTGRYAFVDDSFLTLVEDNVHMDAFIKVAPENNLMFTGCLAMKAGMLREALRGMDFNHYEFFGVHFEYALWQRTAQLCSPDEWPLSLPTRFPSLSRCQVLRLPRLGIAATRATEAHARVW